MPRGRYQQQQWEMREKAILDALIELAAARGMAAVTMDELAEAVGISKATLYQHFPGKDALLAHLMREHTRQFQAWLDASADDPPLDRLGDTMRYLTQGHITPLRGLIQIERAEMMPIFETDAELVAAHARVLEHLSAIVRQGQAAGEIAADLAPDIVISAMWALSSISTIPHRSGNAASTRPSSDTAEQVIALFLRGIRPPHADS